MGATEEELDPRDYLEPGHRWVTLRRRSKYIGPGTREEGVSYLFGKLIEGRPQEVVLLQHMSMRLRKAIDELEIERQQQGTDHEKWTLAKVAEKSGVSLSTINDLLQGKTWPKLKTVATLELFFGENLWTHNYIQGAKEAKEARRAKKQPPDAPTPSSDDSTVTVDPDAEEVGDG